MIFNPLIVEESGKYKRVTFQPDGITCSMEYQFLEGTKQIRNSLKIKIPPEMFGKMEFEIIEYDPSTFSEKAYLYVRISNAGKIFYYAKEGVDYSYATITEESKDTGTYSIDFFFDQFHSGEGFPTRNQSPEPIWIIFGLEM